MVLIPNPSLSDVQAALATLVNNQPAFIVEKTWIQPRPVSGVVRNGGAHEIVDLSLTVTIPSNYEDYFVRARYQVNSTSSGYFPCHLYAEVTPGGSVLNYGGESTTQLNGLKSGQPFGFWIPQQAGDHDFFVYMGNQTGNATITSPINYELDLCRIIDADRCTFDTSTWSDPAPPPP